MSRWEAKDVCASSSWGRVRIITPTKSDPARLVGPRRLDLRAVSLQDPTGPLLETKQEAADAETNAINKQQNINQTKSSC